jgi:hypothetical protein
MVKIRGWQTKIICSDVMLEEVRVGYYPIVKKFTQMGLIAASHQVTNSMESCVKSCK